MKNLLIIALLFILGVSCKKEKCGTCTTTITTSVNVSTPGYPQTSTTTQNACGDDYEDLDGKTITSTAQQGNIIATSVSNTTCN